ncbi:helix-turn-helix transcriptional regulator [Kitasatospora mediocidica]|uniref:helix-turn-helix transcriptional regulator n=1 Tax=Kitasatospora mediocidica TaxID=58352 RepID=UPI000689988A|nr:helix-turn-helix transcriptional regulator [Kitasatospora mediocidica]
MSLYVLDVPVLYGRLDAVRVQRGLSWRVLAADLRLSPSTFTQMKAGLAPDSHTLGTVLMWLGWMPELALLVREQPVSRRSSRRPVALGSRLPDRELAVLELAVDGLSNAEIAAALWVSRPAVECRLRRAGERLGVRGKSAVVAAAVAAGVLEIPVGVE